jgi:histidinol phosphatase-like PHP family hydrolase
LIRLADYHVHTRFSTDSEADLGEACEAALARGLDEIAFADHADFGHADTLGYLKPVEFIAANLAAEGDFDVLGHLDLVKRDARKFGKVYDGPEPYADLIRAALRSIVERGKGIEINTSPLRRGQPDPCPSLEVLRWYRELGGEILTFGSDAHRPGDIGAHFDVALEMARAAGFTRLARFEKRQVRWVEI